MIIQKKNIFYLFFILYFLLFNSSVFSCTGFVSVDGRKILIGNNEDYSWNDTMVRVRPASASNFGFISVGFSRLDGTFGGMNDQGLFLDSFGTPDCNWVESPDKAYFSGDWFRHLLKTCVTVEEVVAFCSIHNLPYFTTNHLFAADKNGNSVIIEWGDRDIEVIRKNGNIQVITNFFILHPERGGHPCQRYSTATEILNSGTEITRELCRSILDAVHVEDWTRYSNIYELHKGNMYYFNQHNFDEFIKFNITEELARGANNYQIPELMSKIKLGIPENEQRIDPTAVEFTWTGKTAGKYYLYCSTSPDFSGCEPIPVNQEQSISSWQASSISIFLLAIPLGIVFKTRKKMIFRTLIIMILVIFNMVCHHNERLPFIQEFSVTVENLQHNSTYFWKVSANTTATLTSESIVRHFDTD